LATGLLGGHDYWGNGGEEVGSWFGTERFYRQLSGPALIGMESTGNHQWFTSKVPAFKKAKTGAPEIPSQCPTTCVKMGHAATPHTRMMLMEARFRERVESRS
jgi:hypothetical protein